MSGQQIIQLDTSPGLSERLVVEQFDGRIQLWHIRDEDRQPTKRTLLDLPASVALTLSRALLSIADPAGRVLSATDISVIGHYCRFLDTFYAPRDYTRDEERRDLYGVASNLRRVAGIPDPGRNLWPELAACAEPVPSS